MHPARLLLAGTAGQLADQWLVARRHPLQRLLDLGDALERMQPVAASAQLPRRLRTAQEQQRQDRLRGAVDLPGRIEVVVPADGAPAHHLPDQPLVLQPVEPALHVGVAELHHRLAVRLLIARRHERIERQGVVLRCRRLLLHQRPKDAQLERIELARRQHARLALRFEGGDEGHGMLNVNC